MFTTARYGVQIECYRGVQPSSMSATVCLIWLKKRPVQFPAWTAGLAVTLHSEESEVICAAQWRQGRCVGDAV